MRTDLKRYPLFLALLLLLGDASSNQAADNHPSGVVGQTYVFSSCWSPNPGEIYCPPPFIIQGSFRISVYSRSKKDKGAGELLGDFVTSFETQTTGTFIIGLKPGDYVFIPDPSSAPFPSVVPFPIFVTVEKKQYTTSMVGYLSLITPH